MNTRTEDSLAGLPPGLAGRRPDLEAFLQPFGWRLRADSAFHTRSLSNGRAASGPCGDWKGFSSFEWPDPSKIWTAPYALAHSSDTHFQKWVTFGSKTLSGSRFRPAKVDWERACFSPIALDCPFAGQPGTLSSAPHPAHRE